MRCGAASTQSARRDVGKVTVMAQGSVFRGKRCFVTGAASGIGRATALKLAAEGAELYLTDRDAEGLAQTVADARALGARVPEHRALDISDYDQVAAFARRHPRRASRDGRGDEHRRRLGVGHRRPAHPPALALDDRHQPDGADPRDRDVPAADGRGAQGWASGECVLGGRNRGVAVARRVQRKQVRAARAVGGAAIRSGPPPHRGVGGGSGRGENPPGADGSDRRRGP